MLVFKLRNKAVGFEKRIIYEAKPIDPEEVRFPGELEKTEEDEKDIELALEILEGYMKALGVEPSKKISLESVHLFYERQFKKLSPYNRECIGLQDPEKSRIQAIKSHRRLATVMTLVHEMVHELGIRKWEFNSNILGKKDKLYRTGYVLVSDEGEENGDGKDKFDAFNEGVVETIAYDAVMKQKENVTWKLKLDLEGFDKKAWKEVTYRDAVWLLDIIIKKLAQIDGKAGPEVFRTIAKGEFTGEMMWMRSIDRIFGPGSLRVLASLHPHPKKPEDIERNQKIIQYFKTEDPGEREKLQTDIY